RAPPASGLRSWPARAWLESARCLRSRPGSPSPNTLRCPAPSATSAPAHRLPPTAPARAAAPRSPHRDGPPAPAIPQPLCGLLRSVQCPPATPVRACRTDRSPASEILPGAARPAAGSWPARAPAPAQCAAASANAAAAPPPPPSTLRAEDRRATTAPGSPNPRGRSSAAPTQSPSSAADAPSPADRSPEKPRAQTPARNCSPPPPPAAATEPRPAKPAMPPPRSLPAPAEPTARLHLPPSNSKIAGGDLLLRGSSSRTFLRMEYLCLEHVPGRYALFIPSEPQAQNLRIAFVLPEGAQNPRICL